MKRRWKLLAVIALMGLVKAAHADSVDNYLTAQMAARHIPGLSVAIVQDGKLVKAQGYGLSDTAAKTPATAETVYQIGSLTKQFTAAAILTLVQQGKVGIDDPVSQYVDGTPAAWSAITVRELLNQTSGIRSYTEALPNALGAGTKDYPASEIVALANAKPLLFKPGTQYAYSNTNYYLLGLIVEKASGKSYADYLQQTFFGPLGMAQTQMMRPGSYVPHTASGTLWDGSTVDAHPDSLNPTLMFSAGGILSTVTDLAKWDAALNGDALLNADSKRLLWTPPTLASGAATQYASGWFATSAAGHQLIWHNGATVAGFTGAIFKFPSDKLTLIVLTNSLDIPGTQTSLPLYSLGLGLANLYLPDLAKEDAGIPDTHPQVTRLLRRTLLGLTSGKVDADTLTPQMRSLLTPETIAQTNQSFAALGSLASLVLLSQSEQNGLKSYRYRAVYGTTPVIFEMVLIPDGKIARLSYHSE